MNKRVWIGLCLLFYAFNLKLLIDDYGQVHYMTVEKGNPLYDEINNYSLCAPFYSIQANNDLRYEADELMKKVSAKRFLSQAAASIEKKINRAGLFKADEGFVFYDVLWGAACFPITKSSLENDSSLELFFDIYAAFLFIHSSGKKLSFFEQFYLGSGGTNNRVYLEIQKQKVYDRAHLSSADCHNARDQLARNRFTCLNACFHQFDLPLTAHPYNDDLHEFDLNLIAKNQSYLEQADIKIVEVLNNREKIDKDFSRCLQKCPERDCFYEAFNVVTVRKLYYDKIISKRKDSYKINLETFIYLPYLSTPLWEFFLQFFGLLTLFTNTSVIGIATFLVVSLAKKLKLDNHRYFGLAFPKFKIFIFASCLLFVLVQSGQMIRQFCFKSAFPNQTSALTFSSKFSSFSVIACFPVELFLYETEEIQSGRNDEILVTNTFEDLKNKTSDVLGKEMIWAQIYLGHKVKAFKLKDRLSDKVLFRNMTCGNSTCLARCFVFEIKLDETRYESLLPTNILDFGFKTKHWRVYLIDKGQPVTTLTRNFKGEFYIRKCRKENLPSSKKSNCKNYTDVREFACQTRMHCVDRCIVSRYIERHRQLPLFSIIDESALISNSKRFQFTKFRDTKIEEECFKKFDQTDCLVISFYESIQTSYSYREKHLNINLNFETLIVKESEQSVVKLVLNILNLESIFFGSNVITLLLALVLYLKRLFRFKWYPFYRHLIILVGLTGFALHVTSIFYGIVKDPLLKIGYFEEIRKPFLPNQIFCFEFNESKINPNVKLTGRYLDELTNEELNYKTIFDYFW